MVDNDRIKKLLDKVYRLNYWFCNEMLIDEQHAAEFEEACKKANESGEPVIMVSTAEGNAKCMKSCMKDTVAILNFLRKEENWEYLEPWQMAGAEAMFNQCSEDNVIPFDLPAALMSVLGMWDELENRSYKWNRYGNVGGYKCGYPGRNQSYYRTGYGKRTGSGFYTAAITNTFDRSYDVNNGRFHTGDDRY